MLADLIERSAVSRVLSENGFNLLYNIGLALTLTTVYIHSVLLTFLYKLSPVTIRAFLIPRVSNNLGNAVLVKPGP